ncbi:MAG TPA: response regulator transcription factor [Gemmatimonadaceae bacterium]
MDTVTALERGRVSYARRQWADAFTHLSAADNEAPLGAGDLERLATAAYMVGRETECVGLWARAFNERRSRADNERAARCAFWASFVLLNRGEMASGGGWVARARRLLDAGAHDCVEQGYLLLPDALQSIAGGDNAAACATFRHAAEIGDRFGDADLVTLARHGEGRALIRLGDTVAGMGLLDEIMVAVTAGEVSPIVVGDVYCGVISACHETFDIRRAQEWTAELGRWCEFQPTLVAFRGQCMVRRAELMQLHGAWPDAMSEARRACEWLSQPPDHPALGAALYQQAELHRLRGELAKADEVYRQASHWGRSPQPGLALLHLARGEVGEASSSIRRAVGAAEDRRLRSRLLAAHVEIMLAANDVRAARAAADELSRIAAELDAPFLHAVSAHATGAVLLAEGDERGALAILDRACVIWRELAAPYEAARTRVLLGLACRASGDDEAGELELEAARLVFERLSAAVDLAHVSRLSRRSEPYTAAGRLTARELQVLRLVASGGTNRAIGRELHISDRTVARHVSNIFVKLGLSSRSAATAYAYEHELI